MGIRLANLVGLSFIALLCVGLLLFARGDVLSLTPVVAVPQLRLDFGFTTLAIPFLLIIAIVAPALGIWGIKRGRQQDGWLMMLFLFAMIAVLLAAGVAAFALAWEAMALVSAFLVGAYHERRNVRRALFSYLIVSQVGALCIVTAFALLGIHAGSFRFAEIAHSAPTLHGRLQSLVILLALIGFGSKAGLMPLHFWLPRAHPVAPANSSALLSGVMLKIAIYGLLLTLFTLAGPLSSTWGIAVMCLGALSAVGGALYASIENDAKRLLAYSSIENVGIIVSAIGLACLAMSYQLHALAALALIAALFHSLNHGVFKSLLFWRFRLWGG